MTKVEYEQAMADSHGRGFGQDEINFRIALREKYIASLEKENETLKSQAIVWHEYPDEKPEPSHEYEVNVPVIIAVTNCYALESDFADYNIDSDTFWRYGTKYKGITHWAYLPAPPKEEK